MLERLSFIGIRGYFGKRVISIRKCSKIIIHCRFASVFAKPEPDARIRRHFAFSLIVCFRRKADRRSCINQFEIPVVCIGVSRMRLSSRTEFSVD